MANKINRRDFLKASLAGAGIVAGSALLAGKWNKPVMAAGGLPAHAKASGGPTATPAAACTPSDFMPYGVNNHPAETFGIGFMVPISYVGKNVDWIMDAVPTVDNGATFSGGTPALSGTEVIVEDSGFGMFQIWHLGSLPNYDEVPVSATVTKTSFNVSLTVEGQAVCDITATDVDVAQIND